VHSEDPGSDPFVMNKKGCSGVVSQLFDTLQRLRVVDLTPRLEKGIPRWPQHTHLLIDREASTIERDGFFSQNISMAEHTGCHVDAPAHIHNGHPTIDMVDAHRLIAPAVHYDFTGLNLGPGELLTKEMFLECEERIGDKVAAGEIALINFGWLKRHWKVGDPDNYYYLNSPGIATEVVELLSARNVRAVGADNPAAETPIVNGKLGEAPGHLKYWLPKNILIIENVANLERLSTRNLFIAVPLKISGGSGSPLRALAYCE
jgi:kynurenine formamidase